MELSNAVLSDLTIFMKYARYMPDVSRRESWEEIVLRNMMMHVKKYPHLQKEIFESYDYVFAKKVLPSMRSMQFGGRAIEISPSRIYNCAYLPIDDYFAFAEVMFLLLGGTGVGYSVQQHHIEKLPPVRKPFKRTRRFLIPDSIEGWADSVKVLVKSYFFGTSSPEFDFSAIRPKGSPLKTAGGKAPGHEPLKKCLEKIRAIFDAKEVNSKLTSLEVHDILCHIADAVLSGGIRRSAMIALFSFDDEDMIKAKYGNWYEENIQRSRSNNSAVILRHKIKKKEFMEFWEKIKNSNAGEPGIFLTHNQDMGTNPCGEISLKPFQFCNLCEVNVSDVETQEEFNKRAKAAAFIGTLQAGYTDFHYIRDIWRETTEKDALLGIGMTGIASGRVLKLDMEEAAKVASEENARVAKLIKINKAARVTTVKPSGTSSLVLGCSSGIHAWYSEYYIRRLTVVKNEPIYAYLKKKLPDLVEDSKYKINEAYIKIPVQAPNGSITRNESALDLLNRVKNVYENWVLAGHRKGQNTNNVSATINLKSHEWDEVGEWMWKNRDCYNGLTVLPHDGGSYVQAPHTECTKEEYENLVRYITSIDLTEVVEQEDVTELKQEAACVGGSCEVA